MAPRSWCRTHKHLGPFPGVVQPPGYIITLIAQRGEDTYLAGGGDRRGSQEVDGEEAGVLSGGPSGRGLRVQGVEQQRGSGRGQRGGGWGLKEVVASWHLAGMVIIMEGALCHRLYIIANTVLNRALAPPWLRP